VFSLGAKNHHYQLSLSPAKPALCLGTEHTKINQVSVTQDFILKVAIGRASRVVEQESLCTQAIDLTLPQRLARFLIAPAKHGSRYHRCMFVLVLQ
jgi:uncharacterized protein (DUF1778 family)